MRFLKRLISKENLLARLISLFVACGLWVYVMTEQNPIVERNIEVKLQQVNLPSNMMVFNAPAKVLVKARGTRTGIGDSLESNITASIDLKNVTEGQKNIPVKVVVERGDVVSVTPSEVSIYVDTVSEKKVPVSIRTVGAVSSDMTIGASIITPQEVTIHGASHRIAKVSKVVAPIDITNYKDSFSLESELVAVSDDGYDIPNMKIDPERVRVEATMVSQMLSTNVPIKLVTSGNLPENIIVSKAEIIPKEIRITAPPSVLKDLQEIKTKPIDISNLEGSVIVAAELDIPGKSIPETRSVQIKFSVERQIKDATKSQ